MAKRIKISPIRTYATEDNAVKAVERFDAPDHLRYIIMESDDGRFFPVFLGMEAIEEGINHRFNCLV